MPMNDTLKHYIGGEWVASSESRTIDVVDPSTERPFARIAAGGKADVDKAVAAAKAAFPSFSETPVAERVALLERILGVYQTRMNDMAQAISKEMGAPMWLSLEYQATLGIAHFAEAARYLRDYAFERARGTAIIRKEPIG